MKIWNPSSYEDIKILTDEKYYLDTDEEIKNKGFNYRAFEYELSEYDLIKIFAKKKSIVLNLDGEYAVILKCKEEN